MRHCRWEYNARLKPEIRTFCPLKGYGLEILVKGKGISVWLSARDLLQLYQYFRRVSKEGSTK